MKRILLTTCLLMLTYVSQIGFGADVRVFDVKGPIGPAVSDFFIRSLEHAQQESVELFVIRMDTPGGLDSSMRAMIHAILASNIPVATFVTPSGSRAASAGTYIAYASHIAAMSPATNIGSSTPVAIGGSSPLPVPAPAGDDPEETAENPSTSMEKKVVNDSVAYIRGLAELRGRNVEWAELTVREAANLTASEALEANVVDYIVNDLDELLSVLNGVNVANVNDRNVVLSTENAVVTFVESDWRNEFLQVITNPNIAYILLMIGIYCLIFEFYSPGVGIGGVLGVILLLVAAYALQMMPVNYVGLALLVFGIALLIVEVFTPTFGILAIGGIVSFALGSILLFDAEVEGFGVSIEIVIGITAATAAIVMFIVTAAARTYRRGIVSGHEQMIGTEAIVMEGFTGNGKVRVGGEIWNASFDGELAADDVVRVKEVDGLKLQLEREENS